MFLVSSGRWTTPTVTRTSLGVYYNNLSAVEFGDGQARQGLASLKKALEVKEQLAVRHPDMPDYQANLVRSLYRMVEYATDQEQARAYQHRAETLAKELNRLHPGVAQYQTALASSLHVGAKLHEKANRIREAIAAQDEAIAVWEKLVRTTDIPSTGPC